VHIAGAQVSSSAVIETINADSMTSATALRLRTQFHYSRKTIKIDRIFFVDFPNTRFPS